MFIITDSECNIGNLSLSTIFKNSSFIVQRNLVGSVFSFRIKAHSTGGDTLDLQVFFDDVPRFLHSFIRAFGRLFFEGWQGSVQQEKYFR